MGSIPCTRVRIQLLIGVVQQRHRRPPFCHDEGLVVLDDRFRHARSANTKYERSTASQPRRYGVAEVHDARFVHVGVISQFATAGHGDGSAALACSPRYAYAVDVPRSPHD